MADTGTKAAQKKHHFEFFGPHGPALLVFVLPAVCYALILGCNKDSCLQLWPELKLPSLQSNIQWYSKEAIVAYLAWFLGLALLHVLLPGQRAEGVVLPDGKRLTYKLNAFRLFVLAYGAALYFGFYTRQLDLGWLYDQFAPLLTASVAFSTALSVYLYASSFRKGLMLSGHGNTGYPAYDFWMGRELNPRLLGGLFDLKEFCELYPGLIGWALLNLGMAHKQLTTHGSVSNSMLLVNVFQLYYIVDALWNERAILTTMDITTDGFGFMLAFGDLAWVPFTFTSAARYLVDHPKVLSPAGMALVLAVKALGYYIFRGANSQKDMFRSNPNDPRVAHLKTLKTERGTSLIVSGWWGTARHINYFGDWIMGLAWCMPAGLTGLSAIVPYFYCIYFAALLVHRERRDEHSCRLKYGKDWDKYCALVRYRIIPYLY
ncbi:hypothetical protein PLESTB_000083300 [Pleodorina starrii]|uniref:Delta(14)-sterol reductase ERG24 n=1 Tax=Pleodorina starrii TaxID=330485 RepID=A0A9W6BAQ6_9CHLO|nr:hypothetical protein PLESTM_000079700 [Pleodorina starrii]GLC48320.1 hypothetical protein PLESTB_000083300 [Pleodorina starrii]GLC66605.1 hypothetical protein PLESTF_000449100 [Pleodorina starrii]